MHVRLDADQLTTALDRVVAETAFDGVIRVDDAAGVVVARAHGLADRAHGIANTVDTRIGMASGSKLFTALAALRLVEQGIVRLDTTARSLLGDELPLIAADVTVEHLLTHRSGIGDYLDEEQVDDIADYVLGVPVHTLATTADFVPLLDGHPTVFPAGGRFAYNNAGFLVLAALIERATGRLFHDLVDELVIRPAGMTDTAFLRLDELPGDAAVGYLYPLAHERALRTNVLHLPVRANGDGGAFTTAADAHTLWRAFFAGRIVSAATRELMLEPRSDVPGEDARHGLGIWLARTGAGVLMDGYDAGQSFRSWHDPERQVSHTVLSNSSNGAWPVVRVLRDLVERRDD